jgi:glycosyltransferase involved in cell wall biosynthesis
MRNPSPASGVIELAAFTIIANIFRTEFYGRMTLNKPLISVIVPHLNQPESLDACLSSLDAQTLGRERFEVIVVDNGSKQLPVAAVERHAGTSLLQELEPGPGLARNRGVLAASADIFAFIDADCRAHPDWLQNALNRMSEAPKHTILGGDVQIWRRDSTRTSAIEAYESVFAYRFKLYIERHNFSGTGNLVVRREDFNRIGPFAGINVAEDIEWGGRALAAGCQFRFVPDVIVYHPARESMRELFVKWDRHLQHAVNMSDGSLGWKLRWVARAAAVLVSPLIDWPKVAFTDRIHGFRERLDAFAMLVIVRAYRAWRMISLLGTNEGVVWNRDTPAEKAHGGGAVNPN